MRNICKIFKLFDQKKFFLSTLIKNLYNLLNVYKKLQKKKRQNNSNIYHVDTNYFNLNI